MKRQEWLAPSILAAAGIAAYANSFTAPFLFDDFFHIVHNPLLDQPLRLILESTRPLTALTLAFNHALGGLDPRGYHLFNLTVHLLAALTFFGIVRRTRPYSVELALAAALLWLLHPLQTQSVTYVVQRGEALMGLFYLLTLYCVIRQKRGWAVLACGLGMLSKPVMVTAPLMVLLYDRTFLSSSWKEPFQKRGRLYAGLAATWLLLPLVLAAGTREYQGLVGDVPGSSPLSYLATQTGVIAHYLKLCFWPHPLLLNYEWPIAGTFREVAFPSLLMGILLGATVWAWRRRPELGFLGVWFFLILAPTSSLLPVADPAFDHRMYLPLAAVVLLSLAGLRRLAGNRPLLFPAVVGLLAVALGTTTFYRNRLYNDPVRFWERHVELRPESARMRVSLGAALQRAGRDAEAMREFLSAIRLKPSSEAYNDIGYMLLSQRRYEEALRAYEEALKLDPEMALARQGKATVYVELGLLSQKEGRYQEALEQYKEALLLDPRQPAAYNNVGTLLFLQARWKEAAQFFRRALELRPAYPEARDNLQKTHEELEKISGPP